MNQLDNQGEVIRAELDVIDDQIIELITERFDLVALIHSFKLRNGFPVRDQDREQEVINRYVDALDEKDGNAIAKAILGIVD